MLRIPSCPCSRSLPFSEDANLAGQAGYAGYGAAAPAGPSISVVIEVPNDKVGLVIGRAGCTIKELEQRSGARVQITPDATWQGKAEPRPIQLTGTQQQIDWCKSLVSEKVNIPVDQLASEQPFQGPGAAPAAAPGTAGGGSEGGEGGTDSSGRPQPYTTPAPGGGIICHVPNDSVGLVIGKQGATIRMLEHSSSARIQIAKECPPGTNMRPITVTGPPAGVESAKTMIFNKVSGVSICFLVCNMPPCFACHHPSLKSKVV